MNAAERAARDAKALELFLGGANYREISAQIGVSARRSEDIVKRELAAASHRRLTLTDQALAIHQERTERLYAQQWKRAEAGDQRAAEICERMLARSARLYGLAEELGPTSPLPAPTATVTPTDAEPGAEDEPQDDLAALRAARSGA